MLCHHTRHLRAPGFQNITRSNIVIKSPQTGWGSKPFTDISSNHPNSSRACHHSVIVCFDFTCHTSVGRMFAHQFPFQSTFSLGDEENCVGWQSVDNTAVSSWQIYHASGIFKETSCAHRCYWHCLINFKSSKRNMAIEILTSKGISPPTFPKFKYLLLASKWQI